MAPATPFRWPAGPLAELRSAPPWPRAPRGNTKLPRVICIRAFATPKTPSDRPNTTMSTQEVGMKFDAQRAKTLLEAFQSVETRVAKASNGREVGHIRLVAVSKLKPASDILALYQQAGQRHFGENYAQELMEKAEVLPKDIRWHFIGGLQSSMFPHVYFFNSDFVLALLFSTLLDIALHKCKPLTSTIPNLHIVSSVDSQKKATQLSLGRSLLSPAPNTPLHIHIQVNTSSEASKSGVTPGPDTTALAKHILTSCPHLNLLGLMTIGAIARSKAAKEGEENEDFVALREERDRLEKELEADLEGRRLELSMGMSDDFQGAIGMGSDEVRVGSTIFGMRPPKEEFNAGVSANSTTSPKLITKQLRLHADTKDGAQHLVNIPDEQDAMAVQEEDPEIQTPRDDPSEQTALLGDHQSGRQSITSENEPKLEGRRVRWWLWRLFWFIVAALVLAVFVKGWVDAGGDVKFDLKGALKRALGGGLSGAAAMVLQVLLLMPLRTIMNYQYRFGTSFTAATRTLRHDGGLGRYYQGMGAALVQGPVSRFGDTAANAGILALLASNSYLKDMPSPVKTIFVSLCAASFRMILTPVDTLKTTLQVQGARGTALLRQRIKTDGVFSLWWGALATAAATFVGNYPWFATYNTLMETIPAPPKDSIFVWLLRLALIGFIASVVSDTVSNSLRVVKTYRQVNDTQVSYAEAARQVILMDGITGLFGRGLKTRILCNGLQGLIFSILWKLFLDLWEKKTSS
ncbi:hypothetical protein JHW43_005965 [Diplocarpon mali]|nr:hypothetical protein JHW43_005965 [Diplocarpon mali]